MVAAASNNVSRLVRVIANRFEWIEQSGQNVIDRQKAIYHVFEMKKKQTKK